MRNQRRQLNIKQIPYNTKLILNSKIFNR